jgi:flagellar capping protein FliD
MSEQRLKVQSGPPDEMYSDDHLDASPQADAPTATEEAKGRAQEVAGQAKEQAQQVAGQAKEQAQEVAGQAKDRAAAEVDARSTQAGEQIGAQAEAIDGVAEELRRQGKDGPAKIAEQASERVKGVADHLQQADGESLVSAAADIARENPAAAAAAGVAAGFVAGRVIKAATGDAPAEEHDVPGRQGDGAA